MMRRNKSDMLAVSDDGLADLLLELGLLSEFHNGILGCEFCEEVVTTETLFAIFPEDGIPRLVCNKPACVRRFSVYVQRTGLS